MHLVVTVFSWWFGAAWPTPALYIVCGTSLIPPYVFLWINRADYWNDFTAKRRDSFWSGLGLLLLFFLGSLVCMLIWPVLVCLALAATPIAGVLLWARREAMIADIIARISGDKGDPLNRYGHSA